MTTLSCVIKREHANDDMAPTSAPISPPRRAVLDQRYCLMIEWPFEFQRVQDALDKRSMTGQEAAREIFVARRKHGPPWHWKNWKRTRVQFLGSECATCGADHEAVLVLQHTVRIPRVQPYLDKAKAEYESREPAHDYRADLREECYAIRDAEVPEMRDCCPLCSSLSIQFRKKAGTWICNSPVGRGYCGHVFEVPAKKEALTAAQKRGIRARKYMAWREKATNWDGDWKRVAILAWLADFREYLSLKHTKTLCKRCAFLEDMTDLKPCLECGFAFSRTESACPDCGRAVAEAQADSQ